MKMLPRLAPLALLWIALATSAHAQDPSPREQFQSAVAAYQKSATEETAQKLAELFKKLDPPPAVPEEAEFRALKGAAFVKQAGDAAAFAKAATEFRAAILAAPWVGEYHYNLAVCEKSAGQFSAAQAALKIAKVLARDDKERKDCLALRAELEAAQELEGARKQDADKAARTEAEKINAKKAKTLIVPGVGIGEVHLGMLEPQVIAALGAPLQRQQFDNGEVALQFAKINILLGRRDKKVEYIGTTHREFRTSDGIGVGSLKSEVSSAMGSPEKYRRNPDIWCYGRGVNIGFSNNPETPSAVTSVSVQIR